MQEPWTLVTGYQPNDKYEQISAHGHWPLDRVIEMAERHGFDRKIGFRVITCMASYEHGVDFDRQTVVLVKGDDAKPFPPDDTAVTAEARLI